MAFKLGMIVDVYMAYMLMLISILIQGHSDLAEERIQHLIISTTKQAMSMLG